MRTSSGTRRKIRVGVIVGNESWRFFAEILEYLRRHFRVSVFQPAAGFDDRAGLLGRDLKAFMDRQDISFFEWSSRLLELATQLDTRSRIVCRLHRYELFTWAETIDWPRVDAAIFVNGVLLEKFRTYWKQQPRQTVVIPPAVSTARFHPLGLALTHRIGTLGWLAPRKRVYELILSFSELSRRLPRLRLSIAGGRHPSFLDYYDSLLALVDRLGLSDRVEFVGEPDHIPAWYRTIDVFVSNSYSEGLQVSLLEAMASACYCLSHAWQGVENVLPDSQIFCADREFQQKLLAYYAMPWPARQRLQMGLREQARRDFDIKVVRRRIRSLIEEVAGR
jgi:glycosyltransferase involved in cell wall biosynthesis